jgi:DNA polymerase (family 10)
VNNKEIAAVLHRIAVYQELAGENPFKALAFDRASRVVERFTESIEKLAQEDRLDGIKGIGKGIAEVLRELAHKGASALLESLKSSFPPGLEELLTLGGLGPKRVRLLWQKLGVASIGELEYACRENRLLALDGFGEKSQQKILDAIAFKKQYQDLYRYHEARAIAEELAGAIEAGGLFARVDIAGSLRRGKRVLKDADILCVPREGADPQAVRQELTAQADRGADVQGIIAEGDTKVSIRRHGMQVDFRLVPAGSYSSALQHFTGSKEHNTVLRGRAKSLGLKMNEYGVFRGESPLETADESSVYGSLGLPWIPPELREGEEEIAAAEAGSLPALVEAGDLQGMIHAHTTYSDGTLSLEELAKACRERGFSYLFLSDHSRSAAYAGGLSVERLREQRREAEAVNKALAPFKVYCGVESDILSDGSLDYPEGVLAELDFVIGSIHSGLSMAPEQATERLLRAVANPFLTILGHPSGALLLSRQGYEYDEERLFAALKEHGVVLEHNCNPYRLDPDWPALKRAAGFGIPVALCPDAHSLEDLGFISLGVLMARKAWLGTSQVFNCRSREEIDGFLQRRKTRAGR